MNDPAGDPPEEREPLLWRVFRSAIAPDVLQDGGRDAPLSRRGRLVFYGIVSALVGGVAILFVLTLAHR